MAALNILTVQTLLCLLDWSLFVVLLAAPLLIMESRWVSSPRRRITRTYGPYRPSWSKSQWC